MGDPLLDPLKPFPASLPLPCGGHAEAQLRLDPAHSPVAGLPIGRLRGRLRARPSHGEQERAKPPPPHVLLGAVRDRPSGRAGHHHRLFQGGQ